MKVQIQGDTKNSWNTLQGSIDAELENAHANHY